MWYETSVFTIWKWVKEAISHTFDHNWIWPMVYSPFPPNLVTFIGHPCIFPNEILAACSMSSGMRFTKACLVGFDLWRPPSKRVSYDLNTLLPCLHH